MEICNVCNGPIKSIPYGDTACVMCRTCSDTEKGIRMFMERKRENVEPRKIPVALYVIAGLLWFPVYTGIAAGGYYQQKKLFRNGDIEKANKSIKVATISCWVMIALGLPVGLYVYKMLTELSSM